MDPNYAMAKFGLESKGILKSKQKGCWHYMKYFFIFSSIIQFLIILGLVLFMLYGNAHGGTELRLKSVENRYNNLTVDHAFLKANLSMVKQKLNIAEKEVKNCTDIVTRMRSSSSAGANRTVFCPKPLTPIGNCNILQSSLDQLNMTCYNERLKAENNRILQQLNFIQYKDNCTKTVTTYANKDQLVTYENEQLKKDKTDLGRQVKMLQETCTTIDLKFSTELQSLKTSIETYLKPADTYDTYQHVKCKPISDTINTRIDFTLVKLRQDVTTLATENAQIRATKDRISEELGSIKQAKDIITSERNNLAAEKASLTKQLAEKQEELNKSNAMFVKKSGELDICQKQQVRPIYPSHRT